MSDLAPFVAAAIESRVVTDLQEENDRLRAEIAETRAAALRSARFGGCIQITGEGGSPIYAHGKLHKAMIGVDEDDDYYTFQIIFTSDAHPMCPISQALTAEIRVNGAKVATLRECDEDHCNSNYGDRYAKFRYCYINDRGTPWGGFGGFGVDIEYGPLAPLGDQVPEPDQLRDEEVETVEFPRFVITVPKANVAPGDVLHDCVGR